MSFQILRVDLANLISMFGKKHQKARCSCNSDLFRILLGVMFIFVLSKRLGNLDIVAKIRNEIDLGILKRLLMAIHYGKTKMHEKRLCEENKMHTLALL